jgi:general secretion pathway protein A
MRAMINYRLSVARNFEIVPSLFSFWGLAAIYLATGGYPRKVVLLCHQVILTMIIRGKKKVGWFFVRSCISRMETPLFRRLGWALGSVLIIIVLGLSIAAILFQLRDADAHKQSSMIKEDINQNKKMPDYLGKLTMTKKRTIWWTLNNIYGTFSPEIVNAVIAANPHIGNKDIIAEGDIIALPSIPANIKPINEGDVIVIVENGKGLETVYNIFREYSYQENMPSLAFFPFWNKKEGINFMIVIDKCFKNIRAAQEAVGKLPPVIAAKTKILSRWNADTIFFNRRALQH